MFLLNEDKAKRRNPGSGVAVFSRRARIKARRHFRLVKPLRKLFLSLDPLRVYPIVASCKAKPFVRSFSRVHLTKAIYRFLTRDTMLLFPTSSW